MEGFGLCNGPFTDARRRRTRMLAVIGGRDDGYLDVVGTLGVFYRECSCVSLGNRLFRE